MLFQDFQVAAVYLKVDKKNAFVTTTQKLIGQGIQYHRSVGGCLNVWAKFQGWNLIDVAAVQGKMDQV